MDTNGGHSQRETNSSSFNNFIDGMQAYVSDVNVPNSEPQFDFSAWDPNLFQSTEQPAPSFPQQTPSFPQDYGQTDHQTTPNAMLSPYGGMQSSISQAQYGQAYENGRPSQAAFDPRTISRPTPSPGPYPAYQFQPSVSYASREQMMPSSNFNMNAGLLQPRPSSTTAQGMQHQAPHSPYFSYDPRQLNQSRYQGHEMGHFSGFPEQAQQPVNTYINPSMLTANGVTVNGTPSHFQNWQPAQNAAYAPNPSARDPRGRPLAPSIRPAGMQQPGPQTGVLIPPKAIKIASKPKLPKDPNALKRPRGRPRKDGDMPRTHQDGQSPLSVSDSDSSDDLAVEEEEPETKPAMLSVDPPTDPLARAMYDAVYAVWSPRNKPAPLEKIKEGFILFGNTVKQVRDAWKVKNEALKEANNAGDLKTIPVLTEEVKRYRNAMEAVLKRTLLFGHDVIIRNLPNNLITIAVLYSFLLDRVNNDDFNGGLVISILQLIARFKLLDEEELERVKMIKILQRWVKKGGPESKPLAQTILNNAKAVTAKNKREGATPASPRTANGVSSTGPKATNQASAGRKQENVAGVKRARDGEVPGQPLKKATVTRPVAQASKPLALQQAEKRRLEIAKQGKVEKTPTNAPAATAATAAKPKTVVTVPLKATSSVFSSLVSASKKPGTSNAARAAAAKDPAGLANNTAKKESSPSVLAEVAATAKPSFSFMDELGRMDKPIEVKEDKVEEHPNETEEQRKKRLRKESRRQLRVTWKPEGGLVDIRLFTHDPDEELGHADSMRRDVDDVGGEGRMLKLHKGLEDLEDEDETGEALESYAMPTEVDFSELDPEERPRNYIKMGGTLSPESPAAIAQAKHEENSVMVIYASPADVPDTPKEPPESSEDDDYQPETAFGEPPERTRRREAAYNATKPQPPAINPAIDLSSLLQKMQQAQPVQVPQYAQPHVTQAPALQPVAPGGVDLTRLLAITNAIKAQQQPQQSQYPSAPIVTPAVQPNLATLMASLSAQQPQALPIGSASNPNPYPGPDNDFSRKHSRNDNGLADTEDEYRSKNKKKKPIITASSDKPYNYKTMVCTFWQVGKCMKGDNCTYRHDES